MDSIFDEDVDEVGGEIEAYCPSPRCKADTTHTIISMYEDEVRRVQCVVCGEVHAYRKPRGDSVEEPGEATSGGKRRSLSKTTWEDAMSRASEGDLANCRPYTVRDTYEQGELVHHPVFDIGFVSELLPDNKVEITFRDRPRIMAHNLGVTEAARMPSISEAPPPRDVKKKKRPKKKEEPAASAHLRSKDEIDEALDLARHAALAKMDESQRSVLQHLEAKAKVEARAKSKAKAEPKKVEKPAKEAAKPAKEAAKPAKEAAKPAKEAAKPAKEAAKPAKEAATKEAKGKAKAEPKKAEARAEPKKAEKKPEPKKAEKPAKGKGAKPDKGAKPAKGAKAAASSKGAKKPAKPASSSKAAASKATAKATSSKAGASKAAKKPAKPAKGKKR